MGLIELERVNSTCSLNPALIRYIQGTGVFQPLMTFCFKKCDVSFPGVPWIRTVVLLSCPGGHMMTEVLGMGWSGLL